MIFSRICLCPEGFGAKGAERDPKPQMFKLESAHGFRNGHRA